MKKVLVLGVGAQGSTAAKKLDDEPNVCEVRCADSDKKAVDSIMGQLKKGKGYLVDAHDLDSIIAAAEGVDLIINGLPLECSKNVLDAALAVKAGYQDYAGPITLNDLWLGSEAAKTAPPDPKLKDEDAMEWYHSLCAMHWIYGPEFAKNGRLAIFGTGSAPGLICAASRYAMRFLDECHTIYNIVWEGTIAKRFQPFWWSPVTALSDMAEWPLAVVDGQLVNTDPFGDPITRQYDGMEEPVVLREHSHDEPIQYYFNADSHFKGVKNVYFKYAGPGMEFAKPLYEAGLLSREEEEFHGQKIVPFDFVLSHIPPAPKYEEEIRGFAEEGLAMDSGCMVIEAYGKKDGKERLVEIHVNSPGFMEAYEKAGITNEMYLTGQSGFLFSKMIVNDVFGDQAGMISSDMLTDEQVDQYFEYAADLGITLETVIK